MSSKKRFGPLMAGMSILPVLLLVTFIVSQPVAAETVEGSVYNIEVICTRIKRKGYQRGKE